jgi:hypothetical protein
MVATKIKFLMKVNYQHAPAHPGIVCEKKILLGLLAFFSIIIGNTL